MPEINWRNFIHSDPEILLGKPVVKGTRLSVEFILGLFANGWTERQIIENYPTLYLPFQPSACAKKHYIQFLQGQIDGFFGK